MSQMSSLRVHTGSAYGNGSEKAYGVNLQNSVSAAFVDWFAKLLLIGRREALRLGRGSIQRMVEESGLSEPTIPKGIANLVTKGDSPWRKDACESPAEDGNR